MIQTLVWNQNIAIDNIESFKLALEKLLNTNARGLILNLEHVAFMNSCALGIIANAAKTAQKMRKELVIINIGNTLKKIFKIVCFYSIVRVFTNEFEAKEYLLEKNDLLIKS